ncbi:hypothetical protein ACP3V5_17130 [Vibrio maritimus]
MPNEVLPYDQGAIAYKSRVPLTSNPYKPSAWESVEWDKGWMAESDIDDSDSYDWASKFTEN